MFQTGGSAKCSLCKAPAVKKMCQKHLNYMKMRFRAWTKERAIKCLCIKCNTAPVVVKHIIKNRIGVYCADHRESNRQKCNKWTKENKAYLLAKYKLARQNGTCVSSPKHGKVYESTRFCQKCYERFHHLKAIRAIKKDPALYRKALKAWTKFVITQM